MDSSAKEIIRCKQISNQPHEMSHRSPFRSFKLKKNFFTRKQNESTNANVSLLASPIRFPFISLSGKEDSNLKDLTPSKQKLYHLRKFCQESPFRTFKVKKNVNLKSENGDSLNVGSQSVASSSTRIPFTSLDIKDDFNKNENGCLTASSINVAIQKSMQDSNLIGDFSQLNQLKESLTLKYLCQHSLKICRLPIVSGAHTDLKCIVPKTVVSLLKEKQMKFLLFDCRYPYEYAGGHIQDAENIYLQDHALKRFFPENLCEKYDHAVLIFYCEFSSKRAPAMIRFVRNHDRNINLYPALFYPEMYLLEGGYKAFYEEFKEYCDPPLYKAMLAEDCAKEFVLCKRKCKSKKSARQFLCRKLPFNV